MRNISKIVTVIAGMVLATTTFNTPGNAQTIGIVLLWIAAFLTIYTGYDYLRKGIDSAISDDEK